MSTPLYQINDIVYLTESANVGSIESYQISEVRQDSTGVWFYKIAVPARPPTSTATVGDRITLHKSFDFELTESELTTYCDAIGLAVVAARTRLTQLLAWQSAQCEDTGTG